MHPFAPIWFVHTCMRVCGFLTHRDMCVGREAQGNIWQGRRGVEIQGTQCPISPQRLMERSQLQTHKHTDEFLGVLICETSSVVKSCYGNHCFFTYI